MYRKISCFLLTSAALSALAYQFPTFNERRTGVPVEVAAEGHGRLGDFATLKTLGQECIDAIGMVPTKEMNVLVIADSMLGTGVAIAVQGHDRFGKKYVKKTYVCNFDNELRSIKSIDR